MIWTSLDLENIGTSSMQRRKYHEDIGRWGVLPAITLIEGRTSMRRRRMMGEKWPVKAIYSKIKRGIDTSYPLLKPLKIVSLLRLRLLSKPISIPGSSSIHLRALPHQNTNSSRISTLDVAIHDTSPRPDHPHLGFAHF